MDQNAILCCGPKIWTRVVGVLGIALALCYAVVAPVVMDQLPDILSKMDRPPSAAELGQFSSVLCATVWTSCVISILMNVLLLMGNEKERTGFLMPWLILSWMDMTMVGLALLMCLFTGFLIHVLVLLIASILPAIFLYAVHKRYAEIQEVQGTRVPVPVFKV